MTAIERKIRAAQALAENASTEEEAEAARDKVFELVAKYQLEGIDLSGVGETKYVPIQRQVIVPSPYALDFISLLGGIAHSLSVVVVRDPKAATEGSLVYLFGAEQDLDLLTTLFKSLSLQARTQVMHAQAPLVNTRAFRRAWIQGFAAVVAQRLMDKFAEISTTGTDLVLKDRKDQNWDFAQEQMGGVRFRKSTSVNAQGYNEGQRHGKRADIGNTRLNSRSQIGQ